jgi:dTDP-4-amino-4,6-dideoxygalactose transaminase
MTGQNIPFIDLKLQQSRIQQKIQDGIAKVLEHGLYVMGPEVREFEQQLALFSGAKYVSSCANGTDALKLALMCENIGAGDAVFVPSFTFVATAEAVALVGATPVFVDVLEDTFNMDPASLESAIDVARKQGLNPKAVIPVDLFGLPADYPTLNAIAQKNGCVTIGDAAQGFGGAIGQRRIGTWADYTTTSFFPAKPLGCYGDGGAVLTDDDGKAALLNSIRNHGQGEDRYDNVRLGFNSRLDSIQAAVLLEKLAIFEDELARRAAIAARYSDGINNCVIVPKLPKDFFSSWAQYTIQVPNRDDLIAKLRTAGVPTAIYYPRPIHTQSPYRNYPVARDGLPVTEKLAPEVLSLPMHPYLEESTQDYIINAVQTAMKAE